jgi:glycosyltransferase involved in cell wall biosynthesis
VSRLQSWKGIHLAIKALPRVHESFPTAMLVIVGGPHFSEPHYEHELRMTAARLGVSDRVVFAGLQDDVRPWLSAMDVLVHPARNEPFGISILEAMALGRPVVASDSGGPLEIIDDGRNGLLFRTGDPGSLAERVVRLLGSPAEAARLAEQARVRATEFSSSRMAEKIGAAVRQLTGLDVERR